MKSDSGREISGMKTITYLVRLRIIDGSLLITEWKTKGRRWTKLDFDAPPGLLDLVMNPRKLRVDNFRLTRGKSADFFCGEVTVRRKLSRMGVYLRRKRGREIKQ